MEGDFRIADWQVQPRLNLITRGEDVVSIQPKVMDLLVFLAKHSGEVLPKERIITAVWSDTFVTDDVLKYSIFELRKAFQDDPKHPRIVETIPRRGYRLVAPVVPETEPVQGPDVPNKATRSRMKLWIAGLAVGVVALIVLLTAVGPSAPPKIAEYRQLTFDGQVKGPPPDWQAEGRRWTIVTDGSRIYFYEEGIGLAQVPVSGGETTPLPIESPEEGRDLEILDRSPDRQELLVTTDRKEGRGERPLWTVSVTGGALGRVGALEIAYTAAWSPDGQRLAYSDGSNLYLAKADGTEPQKMATASRAIREIVWSPDGRRLRFTEGDPFGPHFNGTLWEATDGARPYPVLADCPEHTDVWGGQWTPDGTHFFFLSRRAYRDDLWVLPEKKGFFRSGPEFPVRLTSGPLSYGPIAIDPDGRTVYAVGGPTGAALMRYDQGTGRWEDYLGGLSAAQLDFTRDGQWIVYVSFPENAIWRCRSDGSHREQLSGAREVVVSPKWAPDGSMIAFSGCSAGQCKVYVISQDGGEPEALTTLEQDEADPTWSPDGKEILFGPGWKIQTEDRGLQIFNRETGEITTIPGSERIGNGHWSPDGRYIEGGSGPDWRLRLFDRETQEWEELTDFRVGCPQWSNDGKRLYFETFQGSGKVFRFDVEKKTIEPVVSESDLPPGGRMGLCFNLTPDESIIILRSRGSQELYALDLEYP